MTKTKVRGYTRKTLKDRRAIILTGEWAEEYDNNGVEGVLSILREVDEGNFSAELSGDILLKPKWLGWSKHQEYQIRFNPHRKGALAAVLPNEKGFTQLLEYVTEAKQKLDKGIEGHKVPWPN
jgi:hypothetical protein